MTHSPSSAQSVEPMFDHRDVADLMDCPFCGGRPSLHPVGNNFTKSRKLTVKCTGCRVQLTNAAIRNDFNWLRKITAEAWNRRAAASAQATHWRELCRRLYVELFHCDQQMRSTVDDEGEPHWTQSSVVRDVLADAKQALEATPLSPDAHTIGEDAANVAIGEREALNAALDKLGDDKGQGLAPFRKSAFREGWEARAALTAEKVAGQEPVATLHDDGHYTWHGDKPYDFNYAGWRMKVYAAPQQPAQPGAQTLALTDEQILEIAARFIPAVTEPRIRDCCIVDFARAVIAAHSQAQAAEAVAVEFVGIEDQIKRSDGVWRPCTGCYDTEDGHPTQRYPESRYLHCALGNGCSECGGLGAVWEDFRVYDELPPASPVAERERLTKEHLETIEHAAAILELSELSAERTVGQELLAILKTRTGEGA